MEKQFFNNYELYVDFVYPKRELNKPRPQGGSCPLIYALKDLDGLTLPDIVKEDILTQAIKNLPQIKNIDVIIAIPSNSDLVSRICEKISQHLNAPIVHNIFFKNPIAMKALSLENRKMQTPLSLNFQKLSVLKGKNILLVDDVLATGSTFSCAINLLKSYCSEITLYALARTEMQNRPKAISLFFIFLVSFISPIFKIYFI